MEDELGQKAHLIAGEDGIFDVAVDDDVVFSKQDQGDFIPTPEIVELVKARLENLKA